MIDYQPQHDDAVSADFGGDAPDVRARLAIEHGERVWRLQDADVVEFQVDDALDGRDAQGEVAANKRGWQHDTCRQRIRRPFNNQVVEVPRQHDVARGGVALLQAPIAHCNRVHAAAASEQQTTCEQNSGHRPSPQHSPRTQRRSRLTLAG